MFKRFKNWLIKKLGGYTAAEYNRVNRIPESYVHYLPENYRHEKLRATVAVPMYNGFTSPGAVERDLRLQLANQIEPYMRIERCEDIMNMQMKYRAELVVVKRGGYE